MAWKYLLGALSLYIPADISSILKLEKVKGSEDAVSWTSKEFDYYIQTVDRRLIFHSHFTCAQSPPLSELMNYFSGKANSSTQPSHQNGRETPEPKRKRVYSTISFAAGLTDIQSAHSSRGTPTLGHSRPGSAADESSSSVCFKYGSNPLYWSFLQPIPDEPPPRPRGRPARKIPRDDVEDSDPLSDSMLQKSTAVKELMPRNAENGRFQAIHSIDSSALPSPRPIGLLRLLQLPTAYHDASSWVFVNRSSNWPVLA